MNYATKTSDVRLVGTAPFPAPAKAIPAQVQSVRAQLDEFDKLLGELEDRLSMVLAPATPDVPVGGMLSSREGLLGELQSTGDNISTLKYRVTDILSRLQL